MIRGAYGPGQPYTRMAARSFELWREQERRWNEKLLHSIGVSGWRKKMTASNGLPAAAERGGHSV